MIGVAAAIAALSIRLNVGVAASVAARELARPELVTTCKTIEKEPILLQINKRGKGKKDNSAEYTRKMNVLSNLINYCHTKCLTYSFGFVMICS